MSSSQNEAFSRILIDKALEFSGWDLLTPKQVRYEVQRAESVIQPIVTT
jgi:predicted type IV restriction endonuclease